MGTIEQAGQGAPSRPVDRNISLGLKAKRGDHEGLLYMVSRYLKEADWLEIGLRTRVLNMGRP